MAIISDKSTLDYIVAIATVSTPIFLAFLGGFGWFIKSRVEASQAKQQTLLAKQQRDSERVKELEDKLREDRIATYNAILEPFFLLFMTDAAFATDRKYKGVKKDDLALQRMLSVEYRQYGFKLSLVADDEVVRAYNKLMQLFYHTDKDPAPLQHKTVRWIALMGDFLLEIRRSMGNQSSSLDRWEMIEWFMSDAPTFKKEHQELEARGEA
jgi:hypothetical protein